jgi:tetratricopeptide (TPR) repeat protein
VNGMSELVEIAILAYRTGRYRDAIELLVQVQEAEHNNWLAKLYLALCYDKAGRVSDAHRLFKRIIAECPDGHIRTKAENALPIVEAEMKRKFDMNGNRSDTQNGASNYEDNASEVG